MDHLQIELCLESIVDKLKYERDDIISTLVKYASGTLKSILERLRIRYIGQLSQHYNIIKKIESGSSSQVLVVEDKKNKHIYALKRLWGQGRFEIRNFLEEIAILIDLSKSQECSPYLVCFNDAFSAKYGQYNYKYIFLRTEFIEGHRLEDLRVCLSDKTKMIPQSLLRFIIYSILKGLEYIHSKGVAHRSIKDDNIMFNSNFIKIVDFGSSCYFKKYQERCYKFANAYAFLAPEERFNIDDTEKYSKLDFNKSDLWAVGIILFEFVSNKDSEHYIDNPESYTDRMRELINGSLIEFFSYKKYPLDDDLKVLLFKLLTINPKDRLDAKEALKLINTSKMGNIQALNKFYNDNCVK